MLALFVLITGCDFESIGEDLNLGLDFAPAPTLVSGKLLDAKTQAPIQDLPITIRFSGPDADQVVDGAGESVSEITVDQVGLLSFGLKNNPIPSAENPAEVVMTITADGYLKTSERLLITSDQGSFTAKLVNLNDLPSGVTNASKEFNADDGVDVTTSGDVSTGAQASLSIPEGTVIRDADGNRLTGRLTASVTYFSNQDDDARTGFPGGFSNVNIPNNEGDRESTGSFITAGFAAINVTDDQGREGEQFDGNIDIRIDVPAGTENFEDGGTISEGDMVPLYSFDEDTGEWSFEGRSAARVSSSTSSSNAKRAGMTNVAFQTNHLTYYNLDYFDDDYCRQAEPIVFEGLPKGGFYNWRLTRNGQLFKSGSLYADNVLQFNYAPRDMPMTLTLFDGQTGAEIARQSISNLCDGATIPVSIDTSSLVTVEGDLTVQCPSDDVEIKPSSFALWYRPLNSSSSWNFARMEKGRITIPGLQDGGEYEVWVRLKNRWETRNVTLSAEDIQDAEDVTVRQRNANTYDVIVNITDDEGTICS